MNTNTVIKKSRLFFLQNNCGVLVHVQDGKVTKVTGNPDHPGSRGFIYERAVRAPKWLYHPDQLKHAFKRISARGEGRWQ